MLSFVMLYDIILYYIVLCYINICAYPCSFEPFPNSRQHHCIIVYIIPGRGVEVSCSHVFASLGRYQVGKKNWTVFEVFTLHLNSFKLCSSLSCKLWQKQWWTRLRTSLLHARCFAFQTLYIHIYIHVYIYRYTHTYTHIQCYFSLPYLYHCKSVSFAVCCKLC